MSVYFIIHHQKTLPLTTSLSLSLRLFLAHLNEI
jgi:hypothetical protein